MSLQLIQFKQKASPVWQLAMNFLFPPRCMACGVDVDAHPSFCRDCFQQIRLISDPCCSLCGLPFEYDLGQGALCGMCMHDAPPYDMARAAMHYDDLSRNLITRLKYGDRSEAVAAHARQLLRAGHGLLSQADVIIPVPLHVRRLMQRRFNQSAMLAHALGDISDHPVWPDALIRIRYTKPQAGLLRRERLRNVTGAFRANHRYASQLRGRRVLLVDDVMTTGATINACSDTLRAAGAVHIGVLTLARTIRE